MNWTNLKTYLIILLVTINVFLIFNYVDSTNGTAQLENTDILNTVEFLEKQDIRIKKEVIPTEVYNSNIIECSYGEEYYELIATLISKSEKESINILPDNSIRINTINGSSFTFDSSFGFSYAKSPINENSELMTLENLSDQDNQVSLTREQRKALSFFFNPASQTNNKLSYSVESATTKANGNLLVTCFQHINNIPVYSNTITVELKDNEIINASGTWFFASDTETYIFRLYDQLSILVKEAQLFKANSEDNKTTPYEINAIEHIYSIYRSANNNKVYFIPSWRLLDNNSNERIYNAVNCELYS